MQFSSIDDYLNYQKQSSEIKRKLEEYEDNLPFIDFLKAQLSKIEYIPSNNIDKDYSESSNIIYKIKNRTEIEPQIKMLHSAWTELHHLNLTSQLLSDFSGSDSYKRNKMKEFKKEIIHDLDYMIKARE